MLHSPPPRPFTRLLLRLLAQLSELREELKSRGLNFSGKRPALTKRLSAAVGL